MNFWSHFHRVRLCTTVGISASSCIMKGDIAEGEEEYRARCCSPRDLMALFAHSLSWRRCCSLRAIAENQGSRDRKTRLVSDADPSIRTYVAEITIFFDVNASKIFRDKFFFSQTAKFKSLRFCYCESATFAVNRETMRFSKGKLPRDETYILRDTIHRIVRDSLFSEKEILQKRRWLCTWRHRDCTWELAFKTRLARL